MAWLLRQGEVLASLEVVPSLRSAERALRSADGAGVGAAFVATARRGPSFVSHTALDVAFLDGARTVLATSRATRFRPVLARRQARGVVVAEAGAFERWSLRRGDELEITE